MNGRPHTQPLTTVASGTTTAHYSLGINAALFLIVSSGGD